MKIQVKQLKSITSKSWKLTKATGWTANPNYNTAYSGYNLTIKQNEAALNVLLQNDPQGALSEKSKV